jgi:hypothetical protein
MYRAKTTTLTTDLGPGDAYDEWLRAVTTGCRGCRIIREPRGLRVGPYRGGFTAQKACMFCSWADALGIRGVADNGGRMAAPYLQRVGWLEAWLRAVLDVFGRGKYFEELDLTRN